MKIITGTAKGKRLSTMEGDSVRPTSERIKEAMFSSIQFDIEGRRVLDLFAGSGQLGLEALSRGAVSAMFIDADRDALAYAKDNATRTGFFPICRFLVSDYRNYLRKAAGREVFDLVFIDPPYGMCCCADAVRRLTEGHLLASGALLVLESGEEFPGDFPAGDPVFARFDLLKSTHYGKKTMLNILFYRGEEETPCE